MKDLTKALKCEGLDEESWKRSRLERAAKLAALPESNASEMSMKRQMIDINSNRDKLEEALREINECKTVENQGQDVNFNKDKKKKVQTIIRSALLDAYDQKAYMDLAKECGYEAADEFKDQDNEENVLDENRVKKLEEIKRRYKSSNKNYEKGGQFSKQKSQGYGSSMEGKYPFQGQTWNNPYFGNWTGSPGAVSSQQLAALSLQPQLMPQPQYYSMFGQMMMPNGYGSGSVMSSNPGGNNYHVGKAIDRPRPYKYQPKLIDKSSDFCKICNGKGHWAGDQECPVFNVNPSGTG